MRTLLLAPEVSGYRPSQDDGAILGGGSFAPAMNLARGLVRQPWAVSVEWKACSPLQFCYLMAFWRTASVRGTKRFLIDLILDEGSPSTYVATIVPGTFGLRSTDGGSFTMTSQLVALPLVPGDYEGASDTALIAGLPGGDI